LLNDQFQDCLQVLSEKSFMNDTISKEFNDKFHEKSELHDTKNEELNKAE
jgi:hypothetical protein